MMISIIVPVYRVEKYINRCIDSILTQSFDDFELILVDDGTPDICGKTCDEYAKNDERICVIHKHNGGLSDARNVGIDCSLASSESEWLTFIDSDDWVHPKYLEALYYAVQQTGCNMSICRYAETLGENLDVSERKLSAEIVNSEEFFCYHNVNAIVAWGKLYNKMQFYDIHYPVGRLHEDEFTTYKLLFKNQFCAFVNNPMYYYYINFNSITHSNNLTWRSLDIIEALVGCTQYLKKLPYQKAYIFSLERAIFSIYDNYRKHSNMYNDLVRKRLRKYLRIMLKYCRSKHIFCFNEYNYIYEIAYPKMMSFFWIFQSIRKKLNWK